MRKPGKLRRVTGNICIFLSTAFTLYLAAIMLNRIHVIVRKDLYWIVFRYEMLICAAAVILALDIRFGILTRMRSKLIKVIGWLLRTALLIGLGCIVFLFAKITISGSITTPGTADYAIVMGLALQNGRPTQDLLARVDTAVEFSLENPHTILILTGGNPDENGLTEAAVMRDLLMERGVPEERMILEDRAETTKQNMYNTADIADTEKPVVIITSNYHMERSVNRAEEAGFTYIICRPAPSDPVTYPANVMWEVLQEINRMTIDK